VTPLTEPKQFQPVGYEVNSEMDPFDPMKLTQALRRESAQMASNAALIAPELARRKEPLRPSLGCDLYGGQFEQGG
jgi:type IV pilus assembly protein PilP